MGIWVLLITICSIIVYVTAVRCVAHFKEQFSLVETRQTRLFGIFSVTHLMWLYAFFMVFTLGLGVVLVLYFGWW